MLISSTEQILSKKGNCILGHLITTIWKDIWLLNVLPFCAQQDGFHKLFDRRIAHKDIWFLHVLPFCAGLDFPL